MIGWEIPVAVLAMRHLFYTPANAALSGTIDVDVTVDFHEAGRKHINPRFAPLIPVD